MPTKSQNTAFLVLFAGVSILLFFVFAPFITVLALAAVSAVLLHRLYERLVSSLGANHSLAAGLTVALTLIFIIVPLFFLGWKIFDQAQGLYMSTYADGGQFLNSIQNAIQNPIRKILPNFTFNINAYVGNILALISNNLASLVYQTLYVIFETFIFLLALFFFLRDGRSFIKTIEEMSPLGKNMTTDILDKMHRTIGSVIEGTVFNAIIRLVCISIAFYLLGVPNAVLWGSIGGVVGAIPGLGTPFAFIPAVAYLFIQGDIFAAVGLAILGGAIMLVIDNMLTSYFFGRGLEVSPLFVLFSIFGGIAFFGPLGFVLGPLVLSVFLSIVRVYSPSVESA